MTKLADVGHLGVKEIRVMVRGVRNVLKITADVGLLGVKEIHVMVRGVRNVINKKIIVNTIPKDFSDGVSVLM